MSTNVQGAAHLDFTFAIVTALGGLAGYIKKRSMPSLIGGFAVAAAYTAAGTLIDRGEMYTGHNVGAATSVALVAIMGSRFFKSRKLMPAGILTAVGLAGAAYHIVKGREWAPEA